MTMHICSPASFVAGLYAAHAAHALVSKQFGREVAGDVVLLLLKVLLNTLHHLLHCQASELWRIICTQFHCNFSDMMEFPNFKTYALLK